MRAPAAPVTLSCRYAHEDEELRVIAADIEGFGLVISDWERAGQPAQAGRAPHPRPLLKGARE